MSVSKVLEDAFNKANHPNKTIQDGEKMSKEIKYTLMKLDKMKVSISNTMVLGAQPYSSALEAKLIRIILSQVKSQNFEENFDPENTAKYTFSAKVSDLAAKLYPEKKEIRKSFYHDIQIAARNLNTRDIIIKDKETGEWIALSWTSAVAYNKGMLTIKLSEEILPYISNLNRNFSVFPLDTLLSFSSKYSMRLYEALFAKINRDVKTRNAFNSGKTVEITFDLDEFRIVSSTVGMYGNLYNLKKKCIDPSTKEISESTSLMVEGYRCYGRHGRKVDTITFSIRQNEDLKFDDKIDEKVLILMEKEEIFDDFSVLNEEYIIRIFSAFDLKEQKNKKRISEIYSLYKENGENARIFNLDFKTAFQNATVDPVGYMITMVKNRHKSDMITAFMKDRDFDSLEIDLFGQADIDSSYAGEIEGNQIKELSRETEEAEYIELDEESINLSEYNTTDVLKKIQKYVDDRQEVDLIYVTKILNCINCYYNANDLKDLLEIYQNQTALFNDNIKVALRNADENVVKYLIAMGKIKKQKSEGKIITNVWLNDRFESDFQEILDYWDGIAIKKQVEDPFYDEGNFLGLKPIRRTDIRHKRFVHELFEDGETLDSIKEAIDVAATSSYFLRTQGSFNFFINPKNYYDIASGERDYDTESVNLWKVNNT